MGTEQTFLRNGQWLTMSQVKELNNKKKVKKEEVEVTKEEVKEEEVEVKKEEVKVKKTNK